MARSTRVAADLADVLLGFGGGAVMSGIVMFSTFGALTGIVLAGPRVYYAMAQDGLLFKWFGVVHPTYRTPHRAIALQAAWSCVLVATGTYRALFTRVIYTEWIFFGLLAVALFVLRSRGQGGEARWSWGYPILPAVFVLACVAIVANQLVVNTLDAVVGLSLVALGIPVYSLWARRRSHTTERR